MNKQLIAAVLLILSISVGAACTDPSGGSMQKKQKGWLGVQIRDITSQLKRSMDLKTREGALVNDVVDHSPADSAGIKEKDVIVQFDGKDVGDAEELQKVVSATKPGTKVAVVVLRKGEKKSIEVIVGKAKRPRVREAFTFARKLPRAISIFCNRSQTQGLTLSELNEQLAKSYDVPDGKGVLVWEVEENSAAEKAGLKAGDVIIQVGKKRVDELRDVSRALDAFDENEKVDIEVVRKSARKALTIEIEESEGSQGFDIWPDKPRFSPGERDFYFHSIPDVEINVPQIDLDPWEDQMHEQSDRLHKELRLRVKPHIQIRMRGEV